MRKFLLLLMMLGLICLNAVGFAAAAEIGDAGAVQRPFSERLKIAAAKQGKYGLAKSQYYMLIMPTQLMTRI